MSHINTVALGDHTSWLLAVELVKNKNVTSPHFVTIWSRDVERTFDGIHIPQLKQRLGFVSVQDETEI